MTLEILLNHWQMNRRCTRRVLEAFPEDKLYEYSIGGMRPFAGMVMEFISMTVPILQGVATAKWPPYEKAADIKTKAELLARWDQDTAELDRIWPSVTEQRLLEVDKAFGMWEGRCVDLILYAIDNEVHHRGQGYVYLRSLGIEPPPFWQRS